ncbi:hypothetical protein ACFV0C_36920 [Streptomyces sp. NPDC059568]|uniref:hypothetical protein n=1 Tax=Streptomyces sp. NPDC059568 TaxID=3346868 RepID=UPI0036AB9EB3
MNDQSEPVRPVWIDGDPTMEAIASAVWKQCHTQGTVVADDPRNIAAAAVAAVRTAAGQPADRAAVRQHIAEAFARYDWNVAPAFRSVNPNADHYGLADAVLAVLPEPVDGAAVLREAADYLLARCPYLGRDDALRKCPCVAVEELRRLADEAQQPTTDDACRPVEVDGVPVRVRGRGEFTERDAAFFGEIVRAAKRRYEAEHAQPDAPEQPDGLCAVTFVGGGRCAQLAGHSDGLHMPLETLRKHRRHARWVAADRAAKRSADRAAALRIYMAAADEEQRGLRRELEDARRDADYFQGWADGNGNSLNTALADNARLRAELERAEAAIGRVRYVCDLTITSSVRVQAIDQARDTLAALDRQDADTTTERP